MRAVGIAVRVRVALACLGVHLVTAPLWLGGVFPWGVVCGAATAWIALVAAAWAGGDRRISTPAAAVLTVLGGATLFTALQALPLPCDWVARLHPSAHAHAQAAAGLLATSVPCTVSMDHTNTWIEVLKGVGILCTIFAGHWLGRRRRRAVLALCVLSALVVAVVALLHWGVGAESVFGLYRPRVPVSGRILLGPLMNPNHLGGLLVLGLPLAIGLALEEQRPAVVLGFVSAAVVMMATVVLTESRGALAAACFVLVAQGGLTLAFGGPRGAGRKRAGGRPWWLVAPAVLLLALLASGGVFEALSPLADHDVSKLDIPRAVLPAIGSPLLGVGRGATTVAILPFVDGQVRFTHVESFPVQWAFEWGPVVAAFVVAALGFVVVRALLQPRRQAKRAGGLSLLGLALQNVADYGLEMSGVALVAAAVFGALLPGGRGVGGGLRLSSGALAGLLGLALLALALISPRVLGRSLAEQRRGIEALVAEGASDEAVDAAISAALVAHPAEPTFAILAATAALQQSRPNAAKWVNRTLALAPRWAAPHLLAARALWNRGARRQALMELGDAFDLDPSASVPLLCTLAKRDARLLPKVLEGRQVPDPVALRLQWCVRLEDPAGAGVDRWLERHHPVMAAPLSRTRQRATDADSRRALAVELRARVEREPDRLALRTELVRVLRELDEPQAALAAADAALQALGPQRVLLRLQAEVLAESGDMDGARGVLSRLRELSAGDPGRLADAMALAGRLELSFGQLPLAAKALRKAHGYDNDLRHLLKVAQIAEKLGDPREAARVLRQVCRRASAPMREQACARASQLERKAQEKSLGLKVLAPDL